MLARGPKVVWFHWMQGRDRMPPVPRGCLDSWVARNPDWRVEFVDAETVWQHLDRSSVPVDALAGTSPQVYANAIRLKLLETYGGVWADATTCCGAPLSSWLTYLPGEFFAFAAPAPNRLLGNWFLAAERRSSLVATLSAAYLGLFARLGPLTLMPQPLVDEMFAAAGTTDVFVEPLLEGRTRSYPYFLFHYLFAYLCRHDAAFGRAWDAGAWIDAGASHVAQRLGLTAPSSPQTRARLSEANAVVHKLIWQIDSIVPGTVLHDVLSGVVSAPAQSPV